MAEKVETVSRLFCLESMQLFRTLISFNWRTAEKKLHTHKQNRVHDFRPVFNIESHEPDFHLHIIEQQQFICMSFRLQCAHTLQWIPSIVNLQWTTATKTLSDNKLWLHKQQQKENVFFQLKIKWENRNSVAIGKQRRQQFFPLIEKQKMNTRSHDKWCTKQRRKKWTEKKSIWRYFTVFLVSFVCLLLNS